MHRSRRKTPANNIATKTRKGGPRGTNTYEYHRLDRKRPERVLKKTFECGRLIAEEYFVDKILHREDGPARIEWTLPSNSCREEYYIDGRLHRTDGPTVIIWSANRAIKHEYYCSNEKIHREDGPAIIKYCDGRITHLEYVINGASHNEHGPAIKAWDFSGKLTETYHLCGIELSMDQWRERTKPTEVIVFMKKVLPHTLAAEIWQEYART